MVILEDLLHRCTADFCASACSRTKGCKRKPQATDAIAGHNAGLLYAIPSVLQAATRRASLFCSINCNAKGTSP